MFPGSGLHNELSFLVDAGLTPTEAIQSATIRPMELMGLSDVLGTVEPGKKADLVLLDANPLADISNTRRVVGVWEAGLFYDREELDSMLAAVAKEQERR
jgi:imidazolonepropionase-like amidohydrolase